MSGKKLREATKVEITALVDNYSDFFLADSEKVKRLRVIPPSGPLVLNSVGTTYIFQEDTMQ